MIKHDCFIEWQLLASLFVDLCIVEKSAKKKREIVQKQAKQRDLLPV